MESKIDVLRIGADIDPKNFLRHSLEAQLRKHPAG
jgi:hypothetical protein